MPCFFWIYFVLCDKRKGFTFVASFSSSKNINTDIFSHWFPAYLVWQCVVVSPYGYGKMSDPSLGTSSLGTGFLWHYGTPRPGTMARHATKSPSVPVPAFS
jgi:hypothetical protein